MPSRQPLLTLMNCGKHAERFDTIWFITKWQNAELHAHCTEDPDRQERSVFWFTIYAYLKIRWTAIQSNLLATEAKGDGPSSGTLVKEGFGWGQEREHIGPKSHEQQQYFSQSKIMLSWLTILENHRFTIKPDFSENPEGHLSPPHCV